MKPNEKKKIIADIIKHLKRKGARRIAIFGSYARGDERPDSDIDVLVEFSETKSLLELARIERELTEAIGKKVDLQTMGAISPFIIDIIEKEMDVVYG